jgi:hypothetical protein
MEEKQNMLNGYDGSGAGAVLFGLSHLRKKILFAVINNNHGFSTDDDILAIYCKISIPVF